MLNNLRILVTRPAHQSNNLSDLIEQQGAQSILFPTIRIEPSDHCQKALSINQSINDYDIALFVSQNAIQQGMAFLDVKNIKSDLKIGVIGKGSLNCLTQFGLDSHAIPAKTFNSEGLLETELLNTVKDKKIIIFRGQEGRNLLGDTLQERGALVDYCEVYKRSVPQIKTLDYQECFKATIDLVIFTSTEGVLNAFEMFEEKEKALILQTPWLLISERMQRTAYKLGHNSDIIIAQQASDDGIIASITQWAKIRENE